MSKFKNAWLMVIFVCLSVTLSGILAHNFLHKNEQMITVPYSSFVNDVETNKIVSATISGDVVIYQEKGEDLKKYQFKTIGPMTAPLLTELSKNSRVSYISESNFSILAWMPFILMALILFAPLIGRRFMSKAAQGIMKNKNTMVDPKDNDIRFKDVAGVDEAKEELSEVVDFLKNPEKYKTMGAKIPRGVILSGPPGTGKTLLAKAVAGEANVPFFSMSGSDFVEMFVGVGASRVRSLFEDARKKGPSIIFIDEIDAVCKARSANSYSTNDEREQTVNSFLVEMDGFKNNNVDVIVLGATNRVDTLDPALLRPGRFDRKVVLGNPDIKGRRKILGVHVRKIPLDKDIDLDKISRITPGFSGAELANLVNEAVLFAARDDRKTVNMNDFEKSRDKCLLGAERKSMIMTPEDKKVTAYHEAGHALCGLIKTAGDPLHKVTIIPRGQALGLTYSMPLDNKLSYTLEYIEAKLIMTMGGRAAEDIIFGERKVSNGASGDIQQATSLARVMITDWGMSEKVGMVSYKTDGFRNVSETTMTIIENEVRSKIDIAYQEAKKILVDYRNLLEALTSALMAQETLSAEEIINLPEFKESGLKFNINIETEMDDGHDEISIADKETGHE